MNICALATGRGGAIAIIRVSGPDSIAIVNKHFQPATTGNALLNACTQTLHYGHFFSSPIQEPSVLGDYFAEPTPEPIDDILVSIFRAPHSYTGENSVEISCHASQYIISTILQSLIVSGCRQAAPGEFTQRAYLNGKIDLSQAEAVADLIASTNAATHRMAMSQMRGKFSSELSQLRDKLLRLTSLMELELDFSDHEELEFADRSELLTLSQSILDRIEHLRQSFKTGQALKHGVPVAIVGRTNVGKSTLLNRLVGDDRAIVSSIHGTTRDVIEDTVNIRGIDFRFIDTAGIRDTTDEIERIGIERTRAKMKEASIILHLSDTLSDFDSLETIENLPSLSSSKIIKVLTKIDQQHPALDDSFAEQSLIANTTGNQTAHSKHHLGTIPISAKENININLLEEALISAADIPSIHENDIIITSARHYESLTQAHASLTRVLQGLHDNLPTDLLAEDLRDTLSSLADITGGAITPSETLQNIFSHFCVGK